LVLFEVLLEPIGTSRPLRQLRRREWPLRRDVGLLVLLFYLLVPCVFLLLVVVVV
jgi:hypothetical protein